MGKESLVYNPFSRYKPVLVFRNAEFIRRPARARGKDLKSQATNSIERAKPGKKEINFETHNAEFIPRLHQRQDLKKKLTTIRER